MSKGTGMSGGGSERRAGAHGASEHGARTLRGALAVIPARLQSQRLPRKPLLRESGRYLFEHVYHRVAAAKQIERAILATDATEILEAARSVGVPAVLTDVRHASGTDRVIEVARAHSDHELVLNVQGDEPEIDPEHLDLLVEKLRAGASVATLATPIRSAEEMTDPAAVKVVLDLRGRALYFSRSPIPFARERGAGAHDRALRHVGVYAFRRATLLEFGAWPTSELERLEALEQLRLLEHGVAIEVALIDRAPRGIDTPADYARFLAELASPPVA
jgi:3-deoxy-manno-octulosonate cytidylyltransferase (CMP-KDO synthetase)